MKLYNDAKVILCGEEEGRAGFSSYCLWDDKDLNELLNNLFKTKDYEKIVEIEFSHSGIKATFEKI